MTGKIAEKLLLYKIETKKDSEAFGQLYDLYIEKIYRFVYFKIGSKEESEDITSEVFLKVWNYLISNDRKEISSFSGLVYKVARNCLIDFYRLKSYKQELVYNFETVIELEEHGEESKEILRVEINQEMEGLLKNIRRLKQDYQEVLLLRYIEELSIREMAEILGMSGVGVRVTLHRATKKLKELVEEKS